MENEKNSVKLRFMSGLTAMTLLGSAAITFIPTNAFATGSKIVTSTPTTKYREWAGHKIGQFYDEETGILYNTIEVIENDNASRISEAIIAVYNKEKQIPKADLDLFDDPNTKTSRSSFWPGVVFLNIEPGESFHINPGDILIFPVNYEDFKTFTAEVKTSRAYANYMAKNNIYPRPVTVYIDPKDAINIVNEIVRVRYPDRVIDVDYAYAKAFFKLKSGSDLKFTFKNGAKLDQEDNYYIFQYIPDDEAVNNKLNNKDNPKGLKKTP